MPAAIDITGQRFGRLTAVRFAYAKSGRRMWECKCDCGNVTVCAPNNLKSGATKSCGCLNAETARDNCLRRSTHGMSHTNTFWAWQHMIQRCTRPNHISYHRYGGRGIKVCDRWLESFENFLADMGERPFPGAQLDREDNDGNYEPGNCRWVTCLVNSNNKSTNRNIEFRGRRQSISQWARQVGISKNALRYRIESGWTVEDALTLPINHGNCWRKRK